MPEGITINKNGPFRAWEVTPIKCTVVYFAAHLSTSPYIEVLRRTFDYFAVHCLQHVRDSSSPPETVATRGDRMIGMICGQVWFKIFEALTAETTAAATLWS